MLPPSQQALKATPQAPTSPGQHAVIARQAIVDGSRAIFGYELFNRAIAGNAHTAASDAAFLFNALSHAGSETVVSSKALFINCTHESLTGSHLELVNPDLVVLEVPTLVDSTPEQIQAQAQRLGQLRARGFRLAFDQSVLRKIYTAWLPLASFIKLDMTAFGPDVAEQLVRAVRGHTKAQIVAEKIETEAQYQCMAALGVTLFQGFWLERPALVKTTALQPSQTATLQLITLVHKQAPVAEIEELLKKDPSLSLNLLRFINTSGTGPENEVTSFRDAVTTLGMDKLFRWAALLMTTSNTGGASPMVGNTAAVRGRLMELLAIDLKMPEAADHAFVTGVFSLLDTMLGMPRDKALTSVSLPPSVREALLDNTGPFAPLLTLAKACEAGDDTTFATTATALKLTSHQVNWAHLQALAWAEAVEE